MNGGLIRLLCTACTTAIRTPGPLAPPRRAFRLPRGRRVAVHGAASGTSKMLSRPPALHAAVAEPRRFWIFRPRKSASSPGAITAAFFADAMLTKFESGLAGPAAGAAQVPGALRFGRVSPR